MLLWRKTQIVIFILIVFLIEFYLEDGTKLIQKTINQYYFFFDNQVKKINIEKGIKQIVIQYDFKNIIEYVRWFRI